MKMNENIVREVSYYLVREYLDKNCKDSNDLSLSQLSIDTSVPNEHDKWRNYIHDEIKDLDQPTLLEKIVAWYSIKYTVSSTDSQELTEDSLQVEPHIQGRPDEEVYSSDDESIDDDHNTKATINDDITPPHKYELPSNPLIPQQHHQQQQVNITPKKTPTRKHNPKMNSPSHSMTCTPKSSKQKPSESHDITTSPWSTKDKSSSQAKRPASASPQFRRQIKAIIGSQQSHLYGINGKMAKSKENWIPEDVRHQMVKRNLAVAIQNLESNEKYQNSKRKDGNKDLNHSLERSLSKAKYGIEQRKSCGLCCISFLPVNLVVSVPLKAILDIRDSWGDKYDPEGSARVRVNPNLRRAPACYNATRVCAFCAQLFDQQQDTYRPSWEAKEAERERIRQQEEAVQRNVMSDPLSQISKERLEEMNALSKCLAKSESFRDEEPQVSDGKTAPYCSSLSKFSSTRK